jgi:hypothetical protein
MSNREFYDPPWEETNVVLVDAEAVRTPLRWIRACEACMPVEAQMPFDWVLDQVTGCDPTVTDYVLAQAGICPHCRGSVTEKTLIDLRDEDGSARRPEHPIPGTSVPLKIR